MNTDRAIQSVCVNGTFILSGLNLEKILGIFFPQGQSKLSIIMDLLPFYIAFLTEMVRLSYIDEWYTFHFPSLELYISLNCCKCTTF